MTERIEWRRDVDGQWICAASSVHSAYRTVLEPKPSRVVKVPNTPAPKVELCWKQAPTMERCDRRKGHSGKHTWEYGRIDLTEQQLESIASREPNVHVTNTEMGAWGASMPKHGSGEYVCLTVSERDAIVKYLKNATS